MKRNIVYIIIKYIYICMLGKKNPEAVPFEVVRSK